MIIKTYPNRIDSSHIDSKTSTFYHIYNALYCLCINPATVPCQYRDEKISTYIELFEIIYKESQLYSKEYHEVSEIINELLNLPITHTPTDLISHIKNSFLLKEFKIQQKDNSEVLLCDYLLTEENWENLLETLTKIQLVFKDYNKKR
jgi:hypothetical protein